MKRQQQCSLDRTQCACLSFSRTEAGLELKLQIGFGEVSIRQHRNAHDGGDAVPDQRSGATYEFAVAGCAAAGCRRRDHRPVHIRVLPVLACRYYAVRLAHQHQMLGGTVLLTLGALFKELFVYVGTEFVADAESIPHVNIDRTVAVFNRGESCVQIGRVSAQDHGHALILRLRKSC